jgi:phosphoglycerate dehydrogenase-like enzyme
LQPYNNDARWSGDGWPWSDDARARDKRWDYRFQAIRALRRGPCDLAPNAEQRIMTTKGKTVLVTGSTDGVGRYVAERLAAHRWRVIVHGRDLARGAAVVERITKQGAKRLSGR